MKNISAISQLPFELINLSQDLNLVSVSYSGWPPPTTLSSIDSFNQVNRQDISSTFIVNNSGSIPLLIDRVHHHEKLTTWMNNKSYFEKLRSSAEHHRNDKAKSHLTTTNTSTLHENPLDGMVETLAKSTQSCNKWDSDNNKNIKSQADIILSRLESFKQIYIDHQLIKSKQNEEFDQTTSSRLDIFTFPIMTPHGRVLFDFSKQLIHVDIYIQLMQLARLSNLDKLIQKIFHKSGEYHHIDYKEKRRNQLQKEQQIRNSSAKHLSHQTDKTNCYITMAKAVHFRALSHCFILDGIDISPRFQYDRNILRDACLRFHSYVSNIIQNNDSQHIASLPDCNTLRIRIGLDRITYERVCSAIHSKRTIPLILVLCTDTMRKSYRLLELLLKAYISPNISVVYVTFEEIKPFLIKDTPESFAFENSHNTSVFNNNAEVNDENITISTSENNRLNLSSKTDDTMDKIDLSNEEFLLDYLRASSLILIFMKQLDEIYFTALIRWYNEVLNSDSHSTRALEHFWLITSDYQRAQTVFNMPKTNLFLWPTEHNDFDSMSIIISSILILPVALSINYEIYTEFIDGISIVDKHCQETTIDRNVCIQMALLRIWSTICERKTIGIVTCDDVLQHFGEYVQILLTEYDYIYERKMIPTYVSIHGMSLAKTFLQQIVNEKNNISCDLITISGGSCSIQKPNINDEPLPSLSTHPSQNKLNDLPNRNLYINPGTSELLNIPVELYEIEKVLQEDNTSHPHTFILLDQLTPLTIGVLSGVYQMSIFFENIIRENVFQSKDASFNQNITFDLHKN